MQNYSQCLYNLDMFYFRMIFSFVFVFITFFFVLWEFHNMCLSPTHFPVVPFLFLTFVASSSKENKKKNKNKTKTFLRPS